MPRMSEDYQQFLSLGQRQPLWLWQKMAVGYALGPVQVWGQIQNDAKLKDAFELVYAFNVLRNPAGGMIFSPATEAQPGQHVILRVKTPAPRYSLIGSWMSAPDAKVLELLSAAGAESFSRVLLSESTGLPDAPPGEKGFAGDVSVEEYRSGRVKLQVSATQPAILRISEKYDPNWKVAINGKPAPLYRCDYLFQGVFINPGIYEVVLSYTDSVIPFWVEMSGVVICILAMGNLIRKREPAEAMEGA
jgi:hypothetical protein